MMLNGCTKKKALILHHQVSSHVLPMCIHPDMNTEGRQEEITLITLT